MRTFVKWVGIGFAGLVAVLVIGIGAIVLLFDWNWFKDTIVARASEATGRKVVIEGGIDGELARVPRIRISGIRVANADWARDRVPNMVAIRLLDFRIELLELLRGRVVLPELAIAGARISLEKRRDGTPNWAFGPSVAGAAAEATVPERRTEFPVIGRLRIDDSRIDYVDPANDIDITATISSAEAKGGEKHSLRLAAEGRYKGRDAELALTAGRLLDLREEDKPYPMDLRLRVGDTTFSGRGTALEPLAFDGLEIDLQLAGPDLAELFPITGIPLPPTAAYSLAGHLSRSGDFWAFRNFDGRVGKSDLGGDLKVDVGGKVPMMTANFTSERLDFADLGGFVGAPPDEEVPTKGRDRILPDMDINLNRLHAMNMRVEFRGEQVIAPNMPISRLRTRLILQDGRLTMSPLAFGVAGGAISGPLVLDGRAEMPVVRADFTVKGIGLRPFFGQSEMGEETFGMLGGKVALAGRGRSLAEVLASADGRVTVAMGSGTLSPLLVELIGLDIAEALAVVVSEKGAPVRIRCAVGDMEARNGILHIRVMLVDTSDSNIWAGGTIDLGRERLKLRVRADPKDPSLLSANAPIAVSGPIKNPEIAIDTLGTEGEGGLGEAIGKVLNPILALIPFVDLGLAENTDCGGMPAAEEGQRPKPPEPARSPRSEAR